MFIEFYKKKLSGPNTKEIDRKNYEREVIRLDPSYKPPISGYEKLQKLLSPET